MVDWRGFGGAALVVRGLLIAAMATGIAWTTFYGLSLLHETDPGQ